MIVLMVAFIIGFQGLSMLTQPGKQNPVLGTLSDGSKITRDDLAAASFELQVLDQISRTYSLSCMPKLSSIKGYIYYQNLQRGRQGYGPVNITPETFAIAKKLAAKQGIKVYDFESDALWVRPTKDAIEKSKGEMKSFSRFLSEMRQQNISLGNIRSAITAGLAVDRWIALNTVPGTQVTSNLREQFKLTNEKLAAEVLEIDREKFVPKTNPTEKEIKALFDEYKTVAKDSNTEYDKFNFGYKVPDRTNTSVAFFKRQAVKDSIYPTRAEIKTFKSSNPELVSQFASLSREEREEKIIEEIQQAKSEQLLSRISLALDAISENAQNETNAILKKDPKSTKVVDPFDKYNAYVQEQKVSANSILNRKILMLNIKNLTITDAIAEIKKAAAGDEFDIHFPTGKVGDVTISPELKISLVKTNITVGQALNLVAAQIKDLPKLNWKMLKGLNSAIFADSPEYSNFPLFALKLTEKTSEQVATALEGRISKNFASILGRFLTSKREADKKAIIIPDKRTAVILSGMQTAFIPASAPKEITPEIKKQIIKDWKFKHSFELALADAQKIKSAAELQKRIDALVKAELAKQEKEYDANNKAAEPKKGTPGQQAAAPTAKAENKQAPKPVTPKVDPQTPAQKKAAWRKETTAEIRETITTSYPLSTIQTIATSMPFKLPAAKAHAAKEVFKLAPKFDDTSYTKIGTDVKVIAIKSAGKVMVAQRKNYQPALESTFVKELPELLQKQIAGSQFNMIRNFVALLTNPASMKQFAGFKENIEK